MLLYVCASLINKISPINSFVLDLYNKNISLEKGLNNFNVHTRRETILKRSQKNKPTGEKHLRMETHPALNLVRNVGPKKSLEHRYTLLFYET